MTLYKEYKAEEDAKRIAKQINCLHIQKIQVTLRCKSCGRINTIEVCKNELCPEIADCLCISGRTVPA